MHPGPPGWLNEMALRNTQMASAAAPATRDPAAIRDMLWARFPALPLPAIEEAATLLQPVRAAGGRSRFFATRLARIASRLRPPARRPAPGDPTAP